ncbi:hypothetical protein HYC85_011981 [Camellia sinensis]|uniref:TATA box binding protein associated factor (TAF) histone-like fold domain-containing protein n=1 Tax=Camellia sinensis TaxID=4442 RepID=A0A7J7HDM7_CAMSI|nr:hypothetical protein HYC85_011981 [Camellia sinensis]
MVGLNDTFSCETLQEAIKCMRHSKRTMLTTDDVDSALNLRNVEIQNRDRSPTCRRPIRASPKGGRAKRVEPTICLWGSFAVQKNYWTQGFVIEAPLPKAPLDTSIVCHWLAIEGVKLASLENAPVEVIVAPSNNKKPKQKYDLAVDIKLPIKHVLSRVLQEALESLATDLGLHPLVPYFTYFIVDEGTNLLTTTGNLETSQQTWLLQFARDSYNFFYFIFCLLVPPALEHIFGHVYNNLQTRLTKTLVHTLFDPKRAITQHYNAIQGLASLGPNVVLPAFMLLEASYYD